MKSTRVTWVRAFAYAMAFVTLAGVCILPLVFKGTNTWSIWVAAYAHHVIQRGQLTDTAFIPDFHLFDKGAIRFEADYPAPSILLAVLVLVTSVEIQNAIFIPITALASIIFFVIARSALYDRKDKNAIGLVLAAVYYFFASSMMPYMSIGRAQLGIILLTYFLFLLMKFLQGGRKSATYIFPLCLLTLAIGLSYYTATLSVALATAILIPLSALPSFRRKWQLTGVASISALGVFVFIEKAATPVALALGGKVDLASFSRNVVEYARFWLGAEGEQGMGWYLWRGFTDAGAFYQILERMKTVLWVVTIAAVVVILLSYRWSNTGPLRKMWVFSIIVTFASLSELTYLFILPKSPFRFLTLYGQICLLFILGRLIGHASKLPKLGPFHVRRVMIVACLITLLLIVGVGFGTWQRAWEFGVAGERPNAYYEAEPLSRFLCRYSSADSPVTLSGDAHYTAIVFLTIYVCGKVDSVGTEPLDSDAILLYKSLLNDRLDPFLRRMQIRGIANLMLFTTTKPLWGSALGYTVTLQNIDVLSQSSRVSLMYADGYSRLYWLQS